MEEFTKPLQPNEIEWKVQSYAKNKTWTIVVPYIDVRAVYNRLDTCFGWDKWSTNITATEKGVTCTLTINGVSKTDGADYTGIEAMKGGISNAIKRAAHQFGLGRELYEYPTVMIKGEHKRIGDYKRKLEQITESYLEGGKIVTDYIKKDKPVFLQ